MLTIDGVLETRHVSRRQRGIKKTIVGCRISFNYAKCLLPCVLYWLAYHANATLYDETSMFAATPGAITVSNTEDAFLILASSISERLITMQKSESAGTTVMKQLDADHVERVSKSLRSMATAQATLKSLDGAAHEAYQRTHGGSSSSTSKSFTKSDGQVTGRTARAALRAGCVADALFACELCELLEYPQLVSKDHALGGDGCLNGREIILNTTIEMFTGGQGKTFDDNSPSHLSILVIHDPHYHGGAGMSHGGIDELLDSEDDNQNRGRLLVVIDDKLSQSLEDTLTYLDIPPKEIVLTAGLITEAASVHEGLWKTASSVLKAIMPSLESHGQKANTTNPAIHFVGRSIGGGVAGLSAAMLDGTIPISESKQRRHKASKRSKGSATKDSTKLAADSKEPKDSNSTESKSLSVDSLSGFGRGRVSAMCLGPCPCLSPNVRVSFVTSCIYGDDAVARTTKQSLDRLCSRANRHMKGSILGKRVGWMTDAVSLTVSSLQSHVAGSEGEEGKLALPGRGYLVRPRRLGGLCSIHEVGGVSGREGIRAAVLWQLGDILLSKSLWRHHSLHSYIHGLDRVQLRNFDQEVDEAALH
jgi:hypothetical protein